MVRHAGGPRHSHTPCSHICRNNHSWTPRLLSVQICRPSSIDTSLPGHGSQLGFVVPWSRLAHHRAQSPKLEQTAWCTATPPRTLHGTNAHGRVSTCSSRAPCHLSDVAPVGIVLCAEGAAKLLPFSHFATFACGSLHVTVLLTSLDRLSVQVACRPRSPLIYGFPV